MRSLLDEFDQLIDKAELSLSVLSEDEVIGKPEGKWSKKEILGHLIDSAVNNHQRFVQAQVSAEIRLAAYDQAAWVRVQNYQSEPWLSLVRLWCSYNRHLLHLLRSLPSESLQSMCFIGDSLPVTLESLIRDYVRHLKHHIAQLLPSSGQLPG